MAEIRLYDPRDLDRKDWRQLQTMAHVANQHTFDRPQAEIDAYVDWNDPERYYQSHRDPNFEVGRRYNENQSYSHPRVAIATYLHEPIGFAYSAHNVSGETEEERERKRLTVVKNYLWLREVVVTPWQQQRGVAKRLGRRLLWHAIPVQPVSTYIYPDEVPFLQDELESVGFKPTGERHVKIYGEESEPVRQVRMQARTAYGVLRHLY